MDVASSEFLMPDGRYDLDFKNKGGDQQLTGEELGQLYKDLAAKYPIVSIEDPFDQDDWANYAPFTAAVGDSVQVVGDDLLVTNPSRIVEAGEKKACNALLLKVRPGPPACLPACVFRLGFFFGPPACLPACLLACFCLRSCLRAWRFFVAIHLRWDGQGSFLFFVCAPYVYSDQTGLTR